MSFNHNFRTSVYTSFRNQHVAILRLLSDSLFVSKLPKTIRFPLNNSAQLHWSIQFERSHTGGGRFPFRPSNPPPYNTTSSIHGRYILI